MGGPVRAPLGKMVGERIVHVDSPAIRLKYEKMEEELKKSTSEEVARAQFELNSLKSDHREALKKLEVSESEVRRLGNQLGKICAPVAEPEKPELIVKEDPKEILRLKSESENLKIELHTANELIKKLKTDAARPLETVKYERVTEYKDRIVVKTKKSVLSIAAGISMAIGLIGGHSLKPKAVISDAPIVSVSPSPSPSVVKKSVRVKK
jgi:vacuolar-type H+-ATPase subunit I/STV1